MDGASHRKRSSPAQTWVRPELIRWFTTTLPKSFFASLQQEFGIIGNNCIFTLPVTVWVMMLQRLSPKGTLSSAVDQLVHGHGRALLSDCKRVAEGRISSATGAFSQARSRVPVAALRRIAEHTFETLYQSVPQDRVRDRLFILDGSSIRLSHSASLRKAYPEAQNQFGKSHWPVMRITVAHHAVTGLAIPPRFGPMYGPEAVSEQGLADQLIAELPQGSVLIGDRNFGIFGVAWRATSSGHDVLIRLTAPRARRLAGQRLPSASDRALEWKPSREDRRSWPALPDDAAVAGRLLVIRPEGAKEDMYLFTTLGEPAAEIAALYKERWNVETDLRSLKQQVRLHMIAARSPELVASELLIASAAYNLIRALMNEAARGASIDPRRLSFSRSQDAFLAFLNAVAYVDSEERFEHHWQILLRALREAKLPKRNRPPAPRLVWPKPHGFPHRKPSRFE